MLEIKHYSEDYGTTKNIVDDVNIVVEKGDIFGFIGHNGAGKTTTIKAVVGILDIKQGEIYLDGVSVKDNPIECKKKLAYIPDNPDIYDSLSGIKYLNFIADIFDVDQNKRAILIDKYATLFEIKDVLNNTISSYSHGMKQKLVVISALIHEPKLLVLDEPFVGLDPRSAKILKDIMKEICEDGCSIFFSTHVLEVAEKLCTKIAIIKKGKIIVCGETKDVIGNSSLEEVFLELTENV